MKKRIAGVVLGVAALLACAAAAQQKPTQGKPVQPDKLPVPLRAPSSYIPVSQDTSFDEIYKKGAAARQPMQKEQQALLDHLAEGGSLDVLFVGKFSLDHLPLIEDLLDRGVLQPAWVRPRWLDVPGAPDRLERLRGGVPVDDLYEGVVTS